MSSKYSITNFSMKAHKTWFINLMKVLGALVKPNGIINHSYKPYFVLKVVFPFIIFFHVDLILFTLQIYFRKHTRTMQFIKHIIQSRDRMSTLYSDFIYGSTKSIHMRHVPFFFGTRITGTKHGLRLSLTNPFCKNSSTCL